MADFNKDDINEEELKKYEKEFSDKSFSQKLLKYAKKIGSKCVGQALTLYYVLKKPEVPAKDKALILGALGYLISPLDFIPDIVPLVGYTDDVIAVAYALVEVQGYVDDEVKSKVDAQMKTLFG